MKFFDTHAHYDDEAFDADRDELLQALPAAGIARVVVPGCTLASSRAAIALAGRYEQVYAAVGFHPENCAGVSDADFDCLRTLAKSPKVVAIGEVGLDYYWEENPPRAFQQEVLRRQMALAQELSLPVLLHDRDAHGDCLKIVREFPALRGVFHCYSGSAEDARALTARGWLLGFGGSVTFKNARRAPEVLAEIPLTSLLLETDAPYLAPVPHRGARNDSRYLPLVAEKIAEIRGTTAEEIARASYENALRFFALSD